jgi:hypothetical protein
MNWYQGRYEERLANSLPKMSMRTMPPELSVRLRVLASRECQKQAQGRGAMARVQAW